MKMPKRNTNSATVTKHQPLPKSTARKPLRDVSNAGKATSKSTAKKLPVKCEELNERRHLPVGNQNAALDRLLLVHSDLSSLIHQIDELLVGALKCTSENGRKEVESFATVLSEMQASLKPWVPRFQEVLSAEPVNQMEKAKVGREDVSKMNDVSYAIESPEQSKWDSLVSSSPLVSWRASCANEISRQLFLLTPLPRQKALSVNYKEPSKSALGVSTSSSMAPQPALLDVMEEKNSGDLFEGVTVEQTPKRVSDRPLESKCVSPHSFFRKDGCMFVMTPCLKVSPPRSCVLFEPLAEFSRKSSLGVHQSTPFPKVFQNSDESQDTESSPYQSSQKKPLKYPQFLGIKLGSNYGNRRKIVEESPNWFMSPPKTCVLMEPPDENLQTNAPGEQPLCNVGFNLQHEANPLPSKINDHQGGHSVANAICKQEPCSSFGIFESTPMPRKPESTIRLGRHPGENTLKKELWAKFEAASISEVHFNISALENNSQKGFLDRLDEVS